MKKIILPVIAALSCAGTTAFAEVITLKDGRTINGSIVNKIENTLVVDAYGVEVKISMDDIKSIDMTDTPKQEVKTVAAPKPTPVPQPKSKPQVNTQQKVTKVTTQAKVETKPTPKEMMLPVGKEVHVKMVTSLSSAKNKTGDRFTAALDGDLTHEGVVVAKRGSKIYGEVTHAKSAGRLVGKPELTIELTHIMIGNEMYGIKTNSLGNESGRTLGKTLKQTAGGAAIGGLINGSDGAKDGAAVGAGLAILTKGNKATIDSEALLRFTLDRQLQIKVYK
ncbi:hypothetical protein [Vibrio crassostreae]|uniref:hypothetical protein n=1 Tax=Vibrio crassostreae TaxID=246167 RepID=UPI001B314F8C|nr:hypothetical protein [Vibrio crassostreae]